ncbi:MAG: ATP-dependent sacrificial sulfur transferase LarE [Spirochaetaceae bacterium]|nr:ATP-dependent sacrificial sulfur transferase LarE [Spirochaetaceae bacterium]
MALNEKYSALLQRIRKFGGAAVAFSGGVDSSFLCYAAAEALGTAAAAITIVSPMMSRCDIDCAEHTASKIGIRHILLKDDTIEAQVAENQKDRCYYCKKIEFGAIIAKAHEIGAGVVLDGSNADDERDYRPGLKATAELGVLSPLREAGLTKAEIRELSRLAGLPTWNKPAAACLASRFPYGEAINVEKLRRVEAAEDVMRNAGFCNFRVRSHGNIARLEVAPEERRLFFDYTALDALSQAIKRTGFTFVAFELEGYRMGSLNAELDITHHENTAL